MNTWAILAADHATLTSGIGLSTVPGLGSAALNGFAVGVIAGGAYLAVLNTPWRVAGGALVSAPAAPKRPRPRRARPGPAGHRAGGATGQWRGPADRRANGSPAAADAAVIPAIAVPVAMRPAAELAPLPVADRSEATRPYSDIADGGSSSLGRSIWLPAPNPPVGVRTAGPVAPGYLPAAVSAEDFVPEDFVLADSAVADSDLATPESAWAAPWPGDSDGAMWTFGTEEAPRAEEAPRSARVSSRPAAILTVAGRRTGRYPAGRRVQGRRRGIGNRIGVMLGEMLGDDPEEAPRPWEEFPDEIFWGPSEGHDVRQAGGYQSKHRLKDGSREAKRPDDERRVPRHAAPPQVSASMRFAARYAPQSARYAPRTAS